MLCVPKGVWSSSANPREPVCLEVELAGRFHLRKLIIRWTHGGPESFSVLLAEDHDMPWERYPEVAGPEPGKEPVQTVILTDLFYGRSTGRVRLEMCGLQHPKYIGVEDLQMVGDLDLKWRADQLRQYAAAMAKTNSLESPKHSKPDKQHKAAARPVASPVLPRPAPTSASLGPDQSAKDAEIVRLTEENARLRAEADQLRSKLRQAKSIIDSVV